MINTIIIALILCMVEFLVILIASPMAKPSLVLRFLPKDVREATARYIVLLYVMKAFDIIVQDQWLVMTVGYFKKIYPETSECEGWKDRGFNNRNQMIRIVAYPFLSMITAGVFVLI